MDRVSVTVGAFVLGLAGVAVVHAEPTSQEQKRLTREFAGINFGVGFGLYVSMEGGGSRIEKAVLAGDPPKVRPTDQRTTQAKIMLETHYFFTPRSPRQGVGPFMALLPSDDTIVAGLGGGVMSGFRRAETSQSFNLGIGFLVEPAVRNLGDGVEPGKELPRGETEIRYHRSPLASALLMFSFSW